MYVLGRQCFWLSPKEEFNFVIANSEVIRAFGFRRSRKKEIDYVNSEVIRAIGFCRSRKKEFDYVTSEVLSDLC